MIALTKASAQNIGSWISLLWPIYLINPVDKTLFLALPIPIVDQYQLSGIMQKSSTSVKIYTWKQILIESEFGYPQRFVQVWAFIWV